MKKILALLALVLGVVSCQTEPEGLDVNVGGEVETTVCVSLPEATRADSAVGALDNNVLAGNNTLRYILQIYQGIKDNEGNVTEWVASKETKFEYSDEQSVVFPVRLVPNRDYKFVVWADVVTGENAGDNYYKTGALNSNNEFITDLTNVTIDATKWNAMDEARDAYTGVVRINDYKSTSSINIPLTRPFAKLRVITTDVEALKNLGIEPHNAVATYTTAHYSTFNACDATYSGELTNVSHEYVIASYNETGANKTIFTDYFFANNEVVKFNLDVKESNGETIKANTFSTDIYVRRNYLTTIQGNILTDGNNVTVEVKDAFANKDNLTDEPYYYQTISSEAELLDAIEDGGEYIVVSDIEVTGLVASTQAATRTTGATTINLNGYTITLKADIEVKSGKNIIITDINENGEVGAIVSNGGAIVNEGTLNIEGGHFGANTIENNNGVVNITGGTISQGAITGGANITGGEFTYNPENEIPDGYKVVETENGKYEVRVGDPIAKIGNVEYTTIQAAIDAAEGETTIVLLSDATFKNTSVLAEGKTVILDLGMFTLSAADKNVIRNDGGNLTIKNGTVTRTGDAVGYSVNNASGEITVENATIARGLYTSGSKMTANNANISHDQSSRHAIYAWNCEVAINGGTYHNDNAGNATLMASGSSVVTINGGTFSIADGRTTLGWTSCMIDQNSTAQVIIKDGQFNGGFRINSANTVLTIEGGKFNTNNGSGYTYNNGAVSIKGGTYTDDAAKAFAEKYVAEGYVLDGNEVVKDVKVAKVGNTEYRKIDDAIAAWTNNTTLTLLSDVTLSDVIKISSTEMHTLELGTYTMTAAKGKNAIEIINNGRSKASYALDIKADATNPGGITATSKAVVKTTGKSGVQDRPIIRFYNGVFNASNIVSHSGSSGTNCPQFQFHNGVYNGSMSANRALFQFYGGTFNGKFYISVDSSAYTLISGGKFKYMDNLYGSALNSEKFTIGSTKKVFDRGVYVDAEGYIVVGGPVITDFGDKFTAKATNVSKAGSYLPYSSAAEHGLYYEVAQMAIDKHGAANVVLK